MCTDSSTTPWPMAKWADPCWRLLCWKFSPHLAEDWVRSKMTREGKLGKPRGVSASKSIPGPFFSFFARMYPKKYPCIQANIPTKSNGMGIGLRFLLYGSSSKSESESQWKPSIWDGITQPIADHRLERLKRPSSCKPTPFLVVKCRF